MTQALKRIIEFLAQNEKKQTTTTKHENNKI